MEGKLAQELYEREIRTLPPGEQLQLVALIARRLANDTTIKPKKKPSVLEFEGVGAELWDGIDAQENVSKMRDEWDRRP